MTVSIAAQMWIKTGPGNPTTWDTLNDTLTVEIEAPKVSLTIASQFDATLPAWPFWFGPTSGQRDSKTPTRTGRN